jgi:hypothetical protein
MLELINIIIIGPASSEAANKAARALSPAQSNEQNAELSPGDPFSIAQRRAPRKLFSNRKPINFLSSSHLRTHQPSVFCFPAQK